MGIGLVAYSPLGKGYLTGAINHDTKFEATDFRSKLPRFTPDALKVNQALLDLLTEIAEEKQATVAQIALAWVLAQKPWIVPIPGTTRLDRLEENIGATKIELTPKDLSNISDATAKVDIQGARYPENLQKLVGR